MTCCISHDMLLKPAPRSAKSQTPDSGERVVHAGLSFSRSCVHGVYLNKQFPVINKGRRALRVLCRFLAAQRFQNKADMLLTPGMLSHDFSGIVASYLGMDNCMDFEPYSATEGTFGPESGSSSGSVHMSEIDKSLQGSATGASSFRSSAFRSSMYSDD
jgi:hypothetical protein